MATVSAVILKHHKKQDGTWNAKIRITHKGSTSYIDTSIYATKADLDTKLRLKKVFVDSFLTSSVNEYRTKINNLGVKVEYMSAADIKAVLVASDEIIDLLQFGDEYVERLKGDGRLSTAKRRATNLSIFKTFVGRNDFPVELLTSKKLREFHLFLIKKNYAQTTIVNAFADLRVIFNDAKDFYNDEELGLIRIHNSPFSKFVIPSGGESKKKNLSTEVLRKIRNLELIKEADCLSRDIFILSFYLCGINANDLHSYLIDKNIDRLDYTRNKTKKGRLDKAFFSVKVIDEAKPLVEKYASLLQKRYRSAAALNNRLHLSLSKVIGPAVGLGDLTYYHARHSFATLARNNLKYSLEDVGVALNHRPRISSVTDIYVAKEWELVDEIQRKVADLIK